MGSPAEKARPPRASTRLPEMTYAWLSQEAKRNGLTLSAQLSLLVSRAMHAALGPSPAVSPATKDRA